MSFGEKVFANLYFWAKKNDTRFVANLETLIIRLKILASAIAGLPVDILPTKNGYGESRGDSFVLPNHIGVFDNLQLNEKIYLCRTVFSALLISKCDDYFFELNKNFKLIDQTQKLYILSYSDWMEISRGTILKPSYNNLEHFNSMAMKDSLKNSKHIAKSITGSPSLVKTINLDITNPNPATHAFEKILTAEDYQGGQKQVDLNAEDDDMSDALSELAMSQVVKMAGEAGSVYNANLVFDGFDCHQTLSSPNYTDKFYFKYPEWSVKHGKFLKNWCTVFEKTLKFVFSTNSPDVNSINVVKESQFLKSQLERIFNRPIWVNKQQEGVELDLDAVVRWKSDIFGGNSSINALFIKRQKLQQDIAVLILADTSLSTDSWINNKRVLDIIKTSLVVLTMTLQNLQHCISLAAFYSNTRAECVYIKIKDFKETWDNVIPKINTLTPSGYTRIGPTIRHASYLLDQTKARTKLLVIISDSKPTDYDMYEGIHGEADVYHAVLEARAKNITVRGLVVADISFTAAKRLYGDGNFKYFSDTKDLAGHIIQAYKKAILN